MDKSNLFYLLFPTLHGYCSLAYGDREGDALTFGTDRSSRPPHTARLESTSVEKRNIVQLAHIIILAIIQGVAEFLPISNHSRP